MLYLKSVTITIVELDYDPDRARFSVLFLEQGSDSGLRTERNIRRPHTESSRLANDIVFDVETIGGGHGRGQCEVVVEVDLGQGEVRATGRMHANLRDLRGYAKLQDAIFKQIAEKYG